MFRAGNVAKSLYSSCFIMICWVNTCAPRSCRERTVLTHQYTEINAELHWFCPAASFMDETHIPGLASKPALAKRFIASQHKHICVLFGLGNAFLSEINRYFFQYIIAEPSISGIQPRTLRCLAIILSRISRLS